MSSVNYYKILGLQNSANEKEIRRAYRILARRYHPDVNPGTDSSEKFQLISEAYAHLKDPEKRRHHDLKILRESAEAQPRGHKAYAEEMRKKFQSQSKAFQQKNHSEEAARPTRRNARDTPRGLRGLLHTVLHTPLRFPRFNDSKKKTSSQPKETEARSIAIVELSLSVPEAIMGGKKTIEIERGNEIKKISVKIPSGVHTGNIVRMRSDRLPGEELVILIQLAEHPYLSLDRRGLTVDLPLSIHEAYNGTAIQVPTLENPVMLKIPPRSQTGSLVRIKNKGPKDRNGKPTDLLYRVSIHGPTSDLPPQYANLLEELDNAYSGSVRNSRPQEILG